MAKQLLKLAQQNQQFDFFMEISQALSSVRSGVDVPLSADVQPDKSLRASTDRAPKEKKDKKKKRGGTETVKNKTSIDANEAKADVKEFRKTKVAETKNADINKKDADGETALHRAVRKGAIKEVEELIIRGAEVNAKNNEDETPLSASFAQTDNDRGLVEILLKAGADVNAGSDGDGTTRLHWAALSGDILLAELFISFHANVNARNADGDTPLLYAATEKSCCYCKTFVRAWGRG